jgi:hypothetical protein
MQPSINGRDLCPKRVKSKLFGSIKILPKKAACPKASQNLVSSWDTLWLGLPAKKSVSHVKLSPQVAAGTRGFRRDPINLSNLTVSGLLRGLKNQFLSLKCILQPDLLTTAP